MLDTSGILAALFEDQNHHEECAKVLREAQGPLIVSPFVLAEASAVIRRHAGAEGELAFLEEVERGVFQLVPFEFHEVAAARQAVAKYQIGLATASLRVNRNFPKRFRSVPDL